MKDIGIKPTKLLSELNFGQIWVRTGRLKLEGKMSPNSEKLTKIDFKMMLECSGRLQMKVLGIICWHLLKKWKKIEIWVGPNFVIMDFRGKIAVLRHLEWFLVKSEESRPPLKWPILGGSTFFTFSQKCLFTELEPSQVWNFNAILLLLGQFFKIFAFYKRSSWGILTSKNYC